MRLARLPLRRLADLDGTKLRQLGCVLLLIAIIGCGTTKNRTATDQLLLSDAVDRSVAAIDFRPLAGKTVYLDSAYLQSVKGFGFVNSDYIISSLRQQIAAAGCLLQDDRRDAELIVEARIGVLGSDGYQVSYGLPASNLLSTASAIIPESPPIPTIPELSLGKRELNEASAKIAAFAYDRISRKAIWQSGLSQSATNAKDMWILGIGPFESGSVREREKLATKNAESANQYKAAAAKSTDRPPVDLTAELRFRDGYPLIPGASQRPEHLTQAAESANRVDSSESELKQVSFDEAEKHAKE